MTRKSTYRSGAGDYSTRHNQNDGNVCQVFDEVLRQDSLEGRFKVIREDTCSPAH